MEKMKGIDVMAMTSVEIIEHFDGINYTANYNNKLNNTYHTTIRKHYPTKNWHGIEFVEILHNEAYNICSIIEKKTIMLSQITNWLAYQDAAMSKENLLSMLEKWYGLKDSWELVDVLMIKVEIPYRQNLSEHLDIQKTRKITADIERLVKEEIQENTDKPKKATIKRPDLPQIVPLP